MQDAVAASGVYVATDPEHCEGEKSVGLAEVVLVAGVAELASGDVVQFLINLALS